MSTKLPAELDNLARQKANEYSQEEDFNAGFYDGFRDCATLLVEAQERVKTLMKILELEIKLQMRLHQPGISEIEQEQSWQSYRKVHKI